MFVVYRIQNNNLASKHVAIETPIFETINICYIKTCIYSFFANRFVTGHLSYKGLKLIISERMTVSLRSSLSERALFTFRFASSCDFFHYSQKCVNFYSHQFAFSICLVVNFCGISSFTTSKHLILWLLLRSILSAYVLQRTFLV